jgi:hypothetical protein
LRLWEGRGGCWWWRCLPRWLRSTWLRRCLVGRRMAIRRCGLRMRSYCLWVHVWKGLVLVKAIGRPILKEGSLLVLIGLRWRGRLRLSDRVKRYVEMMRLDIQTALPQLVHRVVWRVWDLWLAFLL